MTRTPGFEQNIGNMLDQLVHQHPQEEQPRTKEEAVPTVKKPQVEKPHKAKAVGIVASAAQIETLEEFVPDFSRVHSSTKEDLEKSRSEVLGKLRDYLEYIEFEAGRLGANFEKQKHELLLAGYINQAQVKEIVKVTDLMAALYKAEEMHYFMRKTGDSEEVSTVCRLEENGNVAFQFKLPKTYRAYSPWMRLCDMETEFARKHVVSEFVSKPGGPKAEIRLYAPKLPPMPTRIITVKICKNGTIQWCAGQDPLLNPPIEKGSEWVRCAVNPQKEKLKFNAIVANQRKKPR